MKAGILREEQIEVHKDLKWMAGTREEVLYRESLRMNDSSKKADGPIALWT